MRGQKGRDPCRWVVMYIDWLELHCEPLVRNRVECFSEVQHRHVSSETSIMRLWPIIDEEYQLSFTRVAWSQTTLPWEMIWLSDRNWLILVYLCYDAYKNRRIVYLIVWTSLLLLLLLLLTRTGLLWHFTANSLWRLHKYECIIIPEQQNSLTYL